MGRVLLICNDAVGERMAGPGIRYWEFARVLGRHFQVKLIVPPFVRMDSVPATEGLPASLHVCAHTRELRSLVKNCDVIVTRGAVLTAYPFLIELGKPLVLDMYNPFLLEGLQRDVEAGLLEKLTSHENDLQALKLQLISGDFFICADEKQRDYWLGMLSTMGRVNPYNHQHDPTLRRLIDLVPFGLPEKPPQHTQPVLKGVYKTIAADDKVILWGGGIWNWFDAPTLIKAMPLILQQRTDVKLFFMGINRPNQNPAMMKAVDQAVALSKELGLYERAILFNDWVPYEERQNYLLEADLGVSLHLDNVETRFAFRTRLLDYVWAGLPFLSTGGDVLSETLAVQGLARLVAPGDVDGVAQTILSLLANPTLRADCAPRFRQVVAGYRWEVVTRPLVEFCSAPHLAPDKAYLRQRGLSAEQQGARRHLLAKSWRALRLGGVSGFLRQTGDYLRWIRSK
ncbi:MAG: glycosyltransferase [Chloroflexota bacterium]|nr:glycosyltransferase [Chloroflexota bacterium]